MLFVKAQQVLSTGGGPEAIQIRLEMLVQYSKCKTQRLLNQHFEKLIKCQVSFQELLHHLLITLAILQNKALAPDTESKCPPSPPTLWRQGVRSKGTLASCFAARDAPDLVSDLARGEPRPSPCGACQVAKIAQPHVKPSVL